MVVVVIIGILAAIAIPSYNGFAARAKASEAKTVLSAIYTAEAAFHAEWNSYTGDLAAAGLTAQHLGTYGAIGFGIANAVAINGATTSGNYVFLKTGFSAATGNLDASCKAVATVGTALSIFKACAQITVGSGKYEATTDWNIDQVKNLKAAL